jgi:hypothetical protein
MLEVVLKEWVTETKETSWGVEKLDEVGERPGQAIDLIDDDDVYSFGSDFIPRLVQGGALQRSAGEAPSSNLS